jgi:anti-anti-sigma factor
MTGAADAGAAITALVVPDRCLIIDMSALDFIDRGSLGALLRVQWLAWSTGGDVALAAPQRHVLQLLALTGRDHAFLIHASVQAAAAALPGRGWVRGCGRPAHGRAGARWPRMPARRQPRRWQSSNIGRRDAAIPPV